MNITRRQEGFHPGDLVIWHDQQGKHALPLPAVVVSQEPDGVVIRARVQGIIKELHVDPKELVER
jgi:hypothetical protein